jgi:hypothetical protein
MKKPATAGVHRQTPLFDYALTSFRHSSETGNFSYNQFGKQTYIELRYNTTVIVTRS